MALPFASHPIVGRGFKQFTSRDVRFSAKFLALLGGGIVTLILFGLEVPIESALAVALPGVGVVLDALFDGAEFLILPVVLACLFLGMSKRKTA